MADLTSMSRKELLEMFDSFLLKVDFRIEHLKSVTKDDGYNWDFSMQSLDALEDFILKNNIDRDHALYDDVASYIGEVVRATYGGKWECWLNMKEDSVHYGMPVITGFNKYDMPLCPYETLRLFVHRKKKGLISNNINFCVNPPEIDF